MATIVIPLQPPPRVNGVKRKRSGNPSDSVTSHHPSFASALSSLNTSPNESDDDEFSESEGSFSDDSDASSERSYARSSTTKKVSVAPILVNGQLVSIQGTKNKKYKCNFPGCQKSYAKPTRLEEHMRSHTGERPFACTFEGCKKSYLRESHLQAHTRSHQPYSARPFVCDELGCGKRFWTSTQLNSHSKIHSGESKLLPCPEPSCNKTFSKHNQVRAHFALAHCPPGTKNFICDHEDCTKSFSTSQKLKAHAKIHQVNRYVCTDEECITSGNQYFQTWTLLQAHIRTVHPPVCPHPQCGKKFSSQKNFKAHLKIHEDQVTEQSLANALHDDHSLDQDDDEVVSIKTSEVGRDWKCTWEGCPKSFKSKKAMTTHINVNHLQQRNFVCDHEGCGRAFGYKHLLQRHCAKLHGVHSAEADGADSEGDDDGDTNQPEKEEESFIEVLTGRAYKRRRLEVQTGSNAKKILRCPWPHFISGGESMQADNVGEEKDSKLQCEAIFHRAYDLRRHLKADHGFEVGKEEMTAWVE